MQPTRLIFIEGVIGSGKSTAARYVEAVLRQQQTVVRLVPEGGDGHPVRLANTLVHKRQPWLDLTVESFIEQSLARWRVFVDEMVPTDIVTVFDGQLFHGNVTDLIMMNADRSQIEAYVAEVAQYISTLNPLVVYLYQNELGNSLRATCEQRGVLWVDYQIGWKLESPYAKCLALSGQEGLIEFYQNYCSICDAILAQLSMPQCWINTIESDWSERYQTITEFLQLSVDAEGIEVGDVDTNNNSSMFKDQLIHQIVTEYHHITTLAAKYPDECLVESGACGQWSAKDTVAHITAWNQRIFSIADLAKRGGKPESPMHHGEDWPTAIQRLNTEAHETTKMLTWTEIEASYRTGVNQLLQFIESCSPHDLSPLSAIRPGRTSIGELIRIYACEHSREHRIALEKWLQQLGR